MDTVYGFLANLLLGAILLVLFPRFSMRVADDVESRPLRSGGWGIVGLVGIPIVLVLLAITIVGIPLALLGFVLYMLALWTGVVYGEFATGRYLAGRFDNENKWVGLLGGILLFSLLGLVPIVGGLPVLLALLVGLGALGTGLRRAWDERGGRSAGPETTGEDTTESA